MTRKDYILIAETIRDDCPMSGRHRLARAFAAKLAVDNPRFDSKRFVELATNGASRFAAVVAE